MATIEENALLDSYRSLIHSEAFQNLEDIAKRTLADHESTSFLVKNGKSLDYGSGVIYGMELMLGFRAIIEQSLEERDDNESV